jgi:hypothetical protein
MERLKLIGQQIIPPGHLHTHAVDAVKVSVLEKSRI